MVLTPIYGDQFYNSANIKARGMGFILSYEDITEETMKEAINDVLSAGTFQSAKKVSHSYRNRPLSPIETAIWWTEYVATTKGAPLLKSHSVYMSAFVYHSFDVYVTIAVILFSIIYLFFVLIRICCKHSRCRSKTE